MIDPIGLIFEAARQRLLKPKDYFERVKRRLTSILLFPLIIAASSAVAALAFLPTEISFGSNSHEVIFDFVVGASDEFAWAAGGLLLAYIFSVGCNLVYARHLTTMNNRSDAVRDEIGREYRFQEMNRKMKSALKRGETNKAISYARFMVQQYSDLLEANPEPIEVIIEHAGSDGMHLLEKH